MSKSSKSKVIIVGAGAAGIAAACRLIEDGLKNVTILEAKNRIGGRLHTVDFGKFNKHRNLFTIEKPLMFWTPTVKLSKTVVKITYSNVFLFRGHRMQNQKMLLQLTMLSISEANGSMAKMRMWSTILRIPTTCWSLPTILMTLTNNPLSMLEGRLFRKNKALGYGNCIMKSVTKLQRN